MEVIPERSKPPIQGCFLSKQSRRSEMDICPRSHLGWPWTYLEACWRAKGMGFYFGVRNKWAKIPNQSVRLNCLTDPFVNDRSSNKMPVAVKEAIWFAVEIHGGFSVEEVKQFVHLMVKEGRLIKECWSWCCTSCTRSMYVYSIQNVVFTPGPHKSCLVHLNSYLIQALQLPSFERPIWLQLRETGVLFDARI